jgi:hypothetical protein
MVAVCIQVGAYRNPSAHSLAASSSARSSSQLSQSTAVVGGTTPQSTVIATTIVTGITPPLVATSILNQYGFSDRCRLWYY